MFLNNYKTKFPNKSDMLKNNGHDENYSQEACHLHLTMIDATTEMYQTPRWHKIMPMTNPMPLTLDVSEHACPIFS